MANVVSKEAELKFREEDFRDLSAPNLFINLWNYNYFFAHMLCLAYNTYSRWCEKILKEQWKEEWEKFDYVVGQIKKCNLDFININNYSSMRKWAILDELTKKKSRSRD